MELGIAIPTPSNDSDWTYVKQFVTSIISQLYIGRQDYLTQVGVVTYRGLSTSHSYLHAALAQHLSAVHTTRVYGPCSRAVNTGVQNDTRVDFFDTRVCGPLKRPARIHGCYSANTSTGNVMAPLA